MKLLKDTFAVSALQKLAVCLDCLQQHERALTMLIFLLIFDCHSSRETFLKFIGHHLLCSSD